MLLALMLSLPLAPDHFTFPLLLKLNYHSHTQSLAAYLAGARPDLVSLLFRTSSCGALDVVSWTTMVLG
ncbi:hypothetical protein E2562_009816 [Oryza meyeriana var. granulata]|nr:hypothetical protein E2562_009816 [Oryza meyeriana var. granulata]